MNSIFNIVFSCFTHEQVKEINKKIKMNFETKQNLKEGAQNVDKIGDFYHVLCSPLMELLHPWLYQCQFINTQYFGYDIYWNFHLEKFNYNVYGESGEYGWHVDANTENTKIDKKLTCLLNLSEEPYEGGEFKLVGVDKKIKFDSGEGLVFTSLQAHKVTPVTKGKRITLTYWGYGPSWR
jgi:predicted 2-oxoglutarate/Fe(II)-dependent dioxygenase YbiX